jgi:hypothetical protein
MDFDPPVANSTVIGLISVKSAISSGPDPLFPTLHKLS